MSAALTAPRTQVTPGRTLTYTVWVWTTVPARRVTATATISRHARNLKFTLCPAVRHGVCDIGALPANQAVELTLTAVTRKVAKTGDPVTLTVVVQGKNMSPAEAAITAIVGQAGSTPTGGGTTTLPPVTFPGVPGSTVTPSNLSGIFPTVTPSSTADSAKHGQRHSALSIVPTSSSMPLDPRLIGGQLVGLAVLIAAVTMVVTRLSLRTPPAAAASAAPTAPAGTAPPAEPESGAASESATTPGPTAPPEPTPAPPSPGSTGPAAPLAPGEATTRHLSRHLTRLSKRRQSAGR